LISKQSRKENIYDEISGNIADLCTRNGEFDSAEAELQVTDLYLFESIISVALIKVWES